MFGSIFGTLDSVPAICLNDLENIELYGTEIYIDQSMIHFSLKPKYPDYYDPDVFNSDH